MSKTEGGDSGTEERVVRSFCNTHCGGTCMLKVHVRDGVITRIETDDGEEPQLRACLRGRAQRQRVYSPDRLKFPMRRVGARGEGKFERISWDEALDAVAAGLKRIRDTYGPGAIIFRGGGGDIGLLQSRRTIDRLLGMSGGYSQTWGYISHEGGRFASLATFGTVYTRNSRDDLLNSRLIVLWGLDPAHTVMDSNTTWYLAQAREAGTPIIGVDPRYTDTIATFARHWIPIRPGTDAAMLIAMAHVMITENLHDRKFLDAYTTGFDRFKDYVMGVEDGVAKTPAWAEGITGVPARETEELARTYATIKPAALLCGIAGGRTAYGEQYHRAAHTLAAMTGNIGVHGGDPGGRCWTTLEGFPFMKPSGLMTMVNPIDESAPRRKNTISADEVRDRGRVNIVQIADAILRGKQGGYPFDYKALYIMNCNFVNQTPDVNKSIRALNTLEFIVVQEQFMTATAKFADILLPDSTFLERNDIALGTGVPFYGSMAKAIEPLYESRSQFDIGKALAARMGLSGYNDKSEDEWLRSIANGCKITDFDEFRSKGYYRPAVAKQFVAFEKEIKDPARNPFPTPSGKIEIYSQRLADMKDPMIPPVPKYIETWESRNDPAAQKYPLQLITIHFKRRAHSQFDNIPWLRELQPQVMQINPIDAESRGILDGAEVRVFNGRGEMRIKVSLTERIIPGVVAIGQGAWYDPDENGIDRGGCTNVVASDRVSPGGAVPTNTALVQVEKA